MARKGLGKGLDILIGSAAAAEGQQLKEIPIKDIIPNPRQPRKRFDPEAIENMAQSVREFGVLQPVVVRAVGTDYELVAGERRWRAAQRAGLEKIPAIIRQSSEIDSLEVALIENIHRADLNGIEEANAYQQLLDDFGITHDELSRKVGKSRVSISNTLRLLQLPASVQKEVSEGRISQGHARAILQLRGDQRAQEELCTRILNEGLSVRQTEELAGLASGPFAEIHPEAEPVDEEKANEGPSALPGELTAICSHLSDMLDARVKGAMGKRKGKLIIEFRGLEDLKRIFENISGPWEADSPQPQGTMPPETGQEQG